ncbi:hypothetical protein EDB84DRAFT_1492849 [Lactarius hengduanensis]|nr:hypothetical protein EDB84DRAFT_1492849 [Lactarius hengduanensis]
MALSRRVLPRFYHNTTDSIASRHSSYPYIPHHRYSLRWKRSGATPYVVGGYTTGHATTIQCLESSFRLGSSKPAHARRSSSQFIRFLLPIRFFPERWESVRLKPEGVIFKRPPFLQFPLVWNPRPSIPPTHFRGYSRDRSMAFEHTSSR